MHLLKPQGSLARLAALFLLFIVLLQLSPSPIQAENPGGTPATNRAVQGQTAAQPEDAFPNLVIWVGNGRKDFLVSVQGQSVFLQVSQPLTKDGTGETRLQSFAYPNFAQILPTAPGSNIALLFSVQSIQQLRSVSRSFGDGVSSAPNTIMLLRTRDQETACHQNHREWDWPPVHDMVARGTARQTRDAEQDG
jgi:hypothetical protein